MRGQRSRRNHGSASPVVAVLTRRTRLVTGALFSVLAMLFVLAVFPFQSNVFGIVFRDPDLKMPPRYIGSELCSTCHQREAAAWRGSHHANAMAHATEKTVLGDFDNAVFVHFGVRSRMFRRGASFLVETDGPDGSISVFKVKYTFGIEPLQQYLVEFPDGRVQALSIAWDSRPRDKGGQRWFHLYPDEKIDHNDSLHWTKLNQNWNFMCAECHSTGVRKNYDPARNSFKTSFAEISVGCEACHGQGSRHAAWARSQKSWLPFARENDSSFGLLVAYAERLNATWSIDPKSGNSVRSARPSTFRTEVESCGMCHARRGQLTEDWVPGRWLSHTHSVSNLLPGLYDASGQMVDEVFNYGSFKQSKMFAAGVTCSDCHDPHSGKLRVKGDGACLQCHSSEKFSAASHHRHEAVSPPVTCVNCHMPARTYMGVDVRHDHIFNVPRPDRSLHGNTPNACNDCHTDRSAKWASDAIEGWHGPHRKGFQTYAPAFEAARASLPEAARLLIKVAGDATAPSIARATALSHLAAHTSPAAVAVARKALADPDPIVRIAALGVLEPLPPQQVWPLAAPLLSDSVRGVRIRAAFLLSSIPHAMQPERDRRAFGRAAEEFVAAQTLNADRPESRSDLGAFYLRQGRFAEAETEYNAARKLSPDFVPAFVNLADLYRRTNREADAIGILRDGLKVSPGSASLLHSLGLALVRGKAPPDESIHLLAQAAELDPENPRYGYVHAVALHSSGRPSQAIAVLQRVLARHPGDRDSLAALTSFEQERGDLAAAIKYAEQLSVVMPEEGAVRRLIEELRRRLGTER